MANTNMSVEQVKSVSNSPEISPSKNDSCGCAGGKPGTTPGHYGKGKMHAGSKTTSGFKTKK